MSAPTPTDLQLVRGLHARDRKTLTRVYGGHHAAIFNLCARILGDREEAKDVTQEVFLKALTTPPPATEDVRLRPWLLRVATNACLNLIRARRADGGQDLDGLAAMHDPYEQARSAELIESSLAALNERYRAALVLKDLHGLGGAELAGALDVSRPTADVLVHRARAAFRRAFARLAGDDAVAPANLALALPVLTVPAALQTLPASIAALATGSAAATAASGAAPAAGVLAKIGAALTTKAAVVAAGAALATGGGVAAIRLAEKSAEPAPAARPQAAAAIVGTPASYRAPSSPRDAWAAHLHAVREHAAGHHAGRHGEQHAAGHADGRDSGHAEGAAADHSSGAEPTTHDATSHDSSTGSPSSTTTSTTHTTRDGGETDHTGSHE